MISLTTRMLTRTYTRALADLSTARRDLTLDLDALAPGLDPDLVDTLRLCLHELHANACKYGHPHAPVVRHLSRAHDGTLTLTVHNRHAPGAAPPVPRVPVERTTTEWDRAEGQRGLLLITRLAATWGHYSWPPRSGLGTLVRATFTA
ncbi:ATP-binding protein [Nocardiopsis sp. NPDC006198]|uniref:ATP-binding protein n=1 Tax=Nocardiopsis sp. NPDC006198 TaxID=3154472 RepID=UPI0033A64C5F